MANTWLKQKSGILLKYASNLPTKLDRVSIKFDYPEVGWLPVHFIKNGVEMGHVEFSAVYDSFEPMMTWLESIAQIVLDNASVVRLDLEGAYCVLSFEPLWFYDEKTYASPKYYDCGILTIYDEANDVFILDALCQRELLVGDIYTNLKDFAKAMKGNPNFVDDWVRDSFNKECADMEEDGKDPINLFETKMHSEIIQDYQRKMDSYHKNSNYIARKLK